LLHDNLLAEANIVKPVLSSRRLCTIPHVDGMAWIVGSGKPYLQ